MGTRSAIGSPKLTLAMAVVSGHAVPGSARTVIMKIDAHQHFWQYSPVHHVWMSEAMEVLRRDYLPEELEPLLRVAGIDGSIVVQARQMPEETAWLLQLADAHDFINGVVGWVDLCSPAVVGQLAHFAAHSKLVGVRHVVHDEPDDGFMLRPEFRRGIGQLQEYGLTYDLLLFPRHLAVAASLVEEFPNQPFVLDHLAKPAIAAGEMSPWREDLHRLAAFPNVFCKLSGMVTEAKWQQWHASDFHRYLDVVMDAFGPQRVMIGSDWPVCTLSGSYAATMNVVSEYIQPFSAADRAAILGGNCARFYKIKSTFAAP